MTHLSIKNGPEHNSNIGCMMNWRIKICVVTNFTWHMHLKLEYIIPLTPSVTLEWFQIVPRHELWRDITWVSQSYLHICSGNEDKAFSRVQIAWIFRVSFQELLNLRSCCTPNRTSHSHESVQRIRSQGTSDLVRKTIGWQLTAIKHQITNGNTNFSVAIGFWENTPWQIKNWKIRSWIDWNHFLSQDSSGGPGRSRTNRLSPTTVPRCPLNGPVRKSLPVSLIKSRWPNLIIIIETPQILGRRV